MVESNLGHGAPALPAECVCCTWAEQQCWASCPAPKDSGTDWDTSVTAGRRQAFRESETRVTQSLHSVRNIRKKQQEARAAALPLQLCDVVCFYTKILQLWPHGGALQDLNTDQHRQQQETRVHPHIYTDCLNVYQHEKLISTFDLV